MRRDVEEPTINEHGEEVHPAFGMASVHRTSVSPPGAVVFDSDVRHQSVMMLEITGATRKRDLHRDWIHTDSHPKIVVEMSEAQWASLVSSINTSGVPVTIRYTEQDGFTPELPLQSRLELSRDEVRDAAHRAFDAVKEALTAYEEKKTAGNLRNLRAAVNNATPNIDYAARTLDEHAENVVQKARADIEAMIVKKAEQVGLDPSSVTLELEAGE